MIHPPFRYRGIPIKIDEKRFYAFEFHNGRTRAPDEFFWLGKSCPLLWPWTVAEEEDRVRATSHLFYRGRGFARKVMMRSVTLDRIDTGLDAWITLIFVFTHWSGA